MADTGDDYLIPLLPNQHALGTIFGFGSPSWNAQFSAMLVGVHDCLVQESWFSEPPGTVIQWYWCPHSFVDEGRWSFVQRGAATGLKLPSAVDCLWATYELFLDDVRQRLGLERQTYQGAEFTFSTNCKVCGATLYPGFARCKKCRAIREEFQGLEKFVADRPGCCCLSGAQSDVRDSEGNYYWAPYFIDRVRAGKVIG